MSFRLIKKYMSFIGRERNPKSIYIYYMKALILLILISNAAALCTNTCDDICTLYCAGCKEVALCNLVLNSSTGNFTDFCNQIIFENKYRSETYTVSCHTSPCVEEYYEGYVAPYTSCNVSCQVCRDYIVCDYLISRLSNNSLIYEEIVDHCTSNAHKKYQSIIIMCIFIFWILI